MCYITAHEISYRQLYFDELHHETIHLLLFMISQFSAHKTDLITHISARKHVSHDQSETHTGATQFTNSGQGRSDSSVLTLQAGPNHFTFTCSLIPVLMSWTWYLSQLCWPVWVAISRDCPGHKRTVGGFYLGWRWPWSRDSFWE